jgi:hypothetical protein
MGEQLTPQVAHNAVAAVLEMNKSIILDHEKELAILRAALAGRDEQVKQLRESRAQFEEGVRSRLDARVDERVRGERESVIRITLGIVARVVREQWPSDPAEFLIRKIGEAVPVHAEALAKEPAE